VGRRRRKRLLEKKWEILDELYERAKREMEKLPEGEYIALLEEMIRGSAISGNEEIVFAKGQEKLFDDSFLERLNKESKRGKGFSLAKDQGEFSWGVILREGQRTVDLTLDVLMDQLRERIEPEIAPLLFSGS
jgi:vacuolar-type H+-ATPase subunit E/Vma4